MSLLAEYIREFGRFQRNARLYLLSNALSGVTTGIFLVLYNLYLNSLGYDAGFIGLVLFTGTIGAGIAIFPAGICVDRLGGKIVLICSNLAIAVMGVGQILFRRPLPLLIDGFIIGIATAFLLVVNAPYLTANSTPEERPHLFSLNIVLGLASTVLGEILGGALPVWFRSIPWLMTSLPSWISWLLASQLEPRSYQLALLFAGIIAGPSLIPLFLLGNDRPRKLRSNRPIASREQKTMTIEYPVHTEAVQPQADALIRDQPVIHHWHIQLTWKRLRFWLLMPAFALIVVQVLVALGAGLFIPYFNLFFVKHLGASSALFGVLDGGANALNALLTLLAPLVALRIGKVRLITLTRLLSIPVMLIIGLSSILPLAATLYPLRQGLMDMGSGIFQVFSMEEVAKEYRGLANSSYQASYQGALALATPLGGFIIQSFGYPPVFVIAAMLYLLALAVFWGRFGRRRKQTQDRKTPEKT